MELADRHAKPPASRSYRFLPLGPYVAVYVATCLIGATIFLAHYGPFIALYEYFSGSQVPTLTRPQVRDNLLLLFLAPALLALGFALATYRMRRTHFVPTDAASRWTGRVVFVLFAAFGLATVIRAGAFDHVGSWTNYGDWVLARDAMFSHISFAGFVDVYVLVPTAAAWVMVAERPSSRRAVAIQAATSLTSVGLCLLLFQKKAALVAVLIIAVAAALDSKRVWTRRRMWTEAAAIVTGLLVVYFALVVAPVISKTSKTVNQAVAERTSHPSPSLTKAQRDQRKRLLKLTQEAGLSHNRTKSIILYAALAPITRTAAAALYYPVVFPADHPFYGLDLGQDILGIGVMPDDNRVVWNVMNPATPGGQVAAPFQFPLYSQVGLTGALLVSAAFGALFGLLWRVAAERIRAQAAAATFRSLIVLLGVYLALDSARDSVLVSYGVIWGLLTVLGLAGIVRIVRRVVVGRVIDRSDIPDAASTSTASSRSA